MDKCGSAQKEVTDALKELRPEEFQRRLGTVPFEAEGKDPSEKRLHRGGDLAKFWKLSKCASRFEGRG